MSKKTKTKKRKKKWKQLRLPLLLVMLLMSSCDIQTGAEAEAMRVVAEAEAVAIEASAEAQAVQLAIDREQARQQAAISASQKREAEAVQRQVDLILDVAHARAKASLIQAFGIVGMLLVFLSFIFGSWAVVYYLTRKTTTSTISDYYPDGQYLSYRPGRGIQIVRQPDREVIKKVVNYVQQ